MIVISPVASSMPRRIAAPLPRLWSCSTTRMSSRVRPCWARSSRVPSVEPSSTTISSRAPSTGAFRTRSMISPMVAASLNTGTMIDSFTLTILARWGAPAAPPIPNSYNRRRGRQSLAISVLHSPQCRERHPLPLRGLRGRHSLARHQPARADPHLHAGLLAAHGVAPTGNGGGGGLRALSLRRHPALDGLLRLRAPRRQRVHRQRDLPQEAAHPRAGLRRPECDDRDP